MSHYFELIEKRESCRNFSQQPVEKEKLLRCLDAARLAPSACNSQPWHYVAVTNPETCAKLRGCVQGLGMNKFADQCTTFVVVVEDKANLSEKAAARFKSQDFASIDLGLSVSQLCYAATEQGLSTCILGWLSASKIQEVCGIPTGKTPRLVICVGYAADDKLRSKTRKPLDEIVTFLE